jgi:hypothetical protein
VHPEAREFAHKVLAGKHFGRVVEVGGRDINGRITDSFTCDQYISLDLEPGPNVDVVADALAWHPVMWQWPDGPSEPEIKVDLVICMEVLEHEPRQSELIEHMLSWLDQDGALLITAGGPGRPEHSAIDGGTLRDGEPYKNLDPQTVIDIFQRHKLFPAEVHYNAEAKDTYAFGVVQIGEPAEVKNTLGPQFTTDLDQVLIGEPAQATGGTVPFDPKHIVGERGPELVDVEIAVPHQCPEDCRGLTGDRWSELHKLVAIAGSEPVQ